MIGFSMVAMMAPGKGSGKVAKKAAAKPKAKAKEDANAKKRKQANMIGQLKNASNKLRRVKAGEISVTQEEMKELQDKVEFWNEYTSLDHKDQKKEEMLDAFSWDKTCSRWMAKTKEVSEEQYQHSSGLDGWTSRFLAASSGWLSLLFYDASYFSIHEQLRYGSKDWK